MTSKISGALRLPLGEQQLAAEAAGRFVEPDAMSAARRGLGDLQPGRATSHDKHRLCGDRRRAWSDVKSVSLPASGLWMQRMPRSWTT